MSVKEVIQHCLDDGMIKGDKIGTSNYYWQFPSDESNGVMTFFFLKKEKLKYY